MNQTDQRETITFSPFLQNATGKLPFPLTNDYLFRATFQRNRHALIGLVSSILGICPQDIKSIDILNPIELGKSIEAKDFILDLKVLLNNTAEDKLRGIDYWARLFKATTWEEIKMLASNNSFLTEAAETVFQLSAEDKIRLQCEAREDFYNQQRYLQQWREKPEKECASLTLEKESLAQENVALAKEKEQLLQSNTEKDELIARLQAEIARQS